ncbi:GatB/YqeY domain-containing protein [Alphaproteobacteria bacterium]|nr:GatB/YqeY domain-containing protein [Alphaproteobacteria bacterium]
MRERINESLTKAVKSQDKIKSSTLRLVNAAIKDRDIASRTADNHSGVSDDEVLEILAKMIRQRAESATTYEEAGRPELAERERAEITIIEEFMPEQMTEEEVAASVEDVLAKLEASSLKDMGRVMAMLKENYAGQMDFSKASAMVKAKLSN